MSDINNILETLVEAKAAIEENPQLKAEIEQLKSQLDSMNKAHGDLQKAHESLYHDHDEACIKVTELGASLEAARFQELATHQKLDKLVSVFSGAINEIVPPVVHTDEPSVSMVDQPTDVGIIDTIQPYVSIGAGSLQTDAILSDGTVIDHKTEEPTVNPTLVTTSEPITEPNGSELKANPTPEPALTVGSGPNLLPEPITSTEGGQKTPFITNPTVESVQSKPYYGRPYSFKANSVTWREWIDGGGQRPWWLTEDVLGQMDQAPQSAASA